MVGKSTLDEYSLAPRLNDTDWALVEALSKNETANASECLSVGVSIDAEEARRLVDHLCRFAYFGLNIQEYAALQHGERYFSLSSVRSAATELQARGLLDENMNPTAYGRAIRSKFGGRAVALETGSLSGRGQ